MDINDIDRKDLSKWLKDVGHITDVANDKILIGNIFDFFTEKLEAENKYCYSFITHSFSKDKGYAYCPHCGVKLI